MKQFFIISLAAIIFGSCHNKLITLKDAYKNTFYIGTAVSSMQIMGMDAESDKILTEHFNSVTAENAMKWERIHPKPGIYNFDTADLFVANGMKNCMFIVGHCLLWHQQTPAWVFTDSSGRDVSREILLNRLHDHIHTIVSRYKGKIKGYDVVNEALNEDGSMRQSKWFEIIGEDYIAKAFEFAHEADPEAELYYNDFNIESPAKRTGVIKIIQGLKSRGLKIDGIGIQGHWHLNSPKLTDIDSSIAIYGNLGLKVMITELDVNVLPSPDNFSGAEITTSFAMSKELNPYPQQLPESMQTQLTNRYSDFFKIFLKHKNVMERVTFWGISDKTSWLNNWPVKGRTNYPLLFDRNYKTKPVVKALIDLMR
jgi:endo-1,4-beta-xylanase